MKKKVFLLCNLLLMIVASSKAGDATAWGDGTGASWSSPTLGTYYSGSTISLRGMTVTLGSSTDASVTWTWNSGNSGLIPSQMPSTDGTSATLITTFSESSPFGTLPTKGCFLKVVPTIDGTFTVTCKPSTDGSQKIVLATMDAEDPSMIVAASVKETSKSPYSYELTGGRTYYFFQLAKSNQLTSYRFTLQGISFHVPQVNDDSSASSWTSTSTTNKINAGDYVQLEGLKMTVGSSDDASTTWSWNSSGMLPTQMPSTDGTSATLVTSFSEESPFGTLPTRGNFFKIEPTGSGKVTIAYSPSTGSGQYMVFVAMDGEAISSASINTNTAATSFTYDVEANGTYYFFQLAYSGQLSGYRGRLRGVSFVANREPEQINVSSSDLSWTSTSETASILAGDFIQLNGVKMTFGNAEDESTTWTWNGGSNLGMIPAQMPSTDGSAATLVTTFSEESPFGTLPTRGNFFKLEATQAGLVTITCKPSTDADQKLVLVEMDGENIAKASINTSIWNDYYNYNVEAGKTYYLFQLSKSGNLTGYRYTFRGISFQSQILDEDADYDAASMVGITALTLRRTLKKDKWNTIVLPVALTNAQLQSAFGENVKMAELTGASANGLTFASVTETEANQPYMIYVDQDFGGEYTFTGITVDSGTPTQTVAGADFVGSYYAETNIPADVYFVKDNYLVKAADGTNKMRGTRAYFNVPAAAGVKSLSFFIDGSEATGIRSLTPDPSPKGEGSDYLYSLAGQRMTQPTKGVNIVAGKKVLVK